MKGIKTFPKKKRREGKNMVRNDIKMKPLHKLNSD